jgi:hypothetical protein
VQLVLELLHAHQGVPEVLRYEVPHARVSQAQDLRQENEAPRLNTIPQPRRLWWVQNRNNCYSVTAPSALDAFDVLRDSPLDEFGLIVMAGLHNDDDANAVAIRSSALMFRWMRITDGYIIIGKAKLKGLPDSTEADVTMMPRSSN